MKSPHDWHCPPSPARHSTIGRPAALRACARLTVVRWTALKRAGCRTDSQSGPGQRLTCLEVPLDLNEDGVWATFPTSRPRPAARCPAANSPLLRGASHCLRWAARGPYQSSACDGGSHMRDYRPSKGIPRPGRSSEHVRSDMRRPSQPSNVAQCLIGWTPLSKGPLGSRERRRRHQVLWIQRTSTRADPPDGCSPIVGDLGVTPGS